MAGYDPDPQLSPSSCSEHTHETRRGPAILPHEKQPQEIKPLVMDGGAGGQLTMKTERQRDSRRLELLALNLGPLPRRPWHEINKPLFAEATGRVLTAVVLVEQTASVTPMQSLEERLCTQSLSRL